MSKDQVYENASGLNPDAATRRCASGDTSTDTIVATIVVDTPEPM